MLHPIKAPSLRCPNFPRDGVSWARSWGRLEHQSQISIREWLPLLALLETLVRHITLFKTPIPSQQQVVAKWGYHVSSLTISSPMTSEILCATGLLLGKSCLSSRDEWNDHHHQTIQPLFPTILFDTTLGWVRSIWKTTGVSWATAQPTPTPSDPTNPRTLFLYWKSRHTFIMTHQGAIASSIEVKTTTDLWMKARQIFPMIHRVTMKYLRVKNHFWCLKTHFCHLKTRLSSEHDESQWTSRQCLCTSMIAIWLTSCWKKGKISSVPTYPWHQLAPVSPNPQVSR